MANRPSVQLSQEFGQRMLLTPRMLQSLEVLELPTQDLREFLRAAATDNPTLSVDEPPGAQPARREERGTPRGRGDEATARAVGWFEDQALAAEPDFLLEILSELPFLDLCPSEERWVRFLAERLDHRGLLTTGDDELLNEAASIGLEPGADGAEASLGRAIARLQSLEPRGLGGRDETEALLLQLDPEDGDYPALCQLIERFLDDVLRNRLPRVAKALDMDIAGLEALVERLGKLETSPARGLAAAAAPMIRPDLSVDWNGSGFELRFDAAGVPEVTIDRTALALAGSTEQPREVRDYLAQQLTQARGLVSALEQRQSTLRRVAVGLFDRQRAFLAHGPSRIAPLTMAELALDLEMHPSTVSRAVAGKYAQTPFGILALRSLFTSEVSSGQARPRVVDELARVVAAEDPTAPLSDDEIVGELTRRGFDVARRTVAKYRKLLGLPSSYRRRKFTDG